MESVFSLCERSRKTLPTWLHAAMAQAVQAARPGQLPLCVLHQAKARHDDDLVVLRLKDFQDWFGSVKEETL